MRTFIVKAKLYPTTKQKVMNLLRAYQWLMLRDALDPSLSSTHIGDPYGNPFHMKTSELMTQEALEILKLSALHL